MRWDDVGSGSVIRYPYLWRRQAGAGETEGRKSRPAAVAIRAPRPEGDVLMIFPITTAAPDADRWAVEIPAAERRRAGLDTDRRQWLVLDEANIDVVGRSYYLEPDATLGTFSRAFFAGLVLQIIEKAAEIEKVSRR